MVSAIGNPIVDYKLAQVDASQLLAQFQKTPTYQQDTSYYQANIGSVTSPEDLLGNYRLLKVALSAFNLQDAISQTGILRKLLTQDPTQKGSLAQQLIDPRYLAFAKAFSSLRSDGGASISSPVNVDAVLAGYNKYQYQIWVGNNDQDTSVRQALYAQSTIQDAIDISNVGHLFTQFQQSFDVQQAADYYKTNIANVTSPSDLLGDTKLLGFALTAYGVDPSKISTSTVQQLLTQDPTSSSSLAQNNPAYLQFAQAFSSLQTDGGVSVQNSSNINTVIGNYQLNAFENTLATNDSSVNGSTFGTTGADEITQIYKDFQSESGVSQAVQYYQANIGNVRSANDLLGDPKLLDVALTAYGITPSSVSTATVQQLLTQDPTRSASLAQQDPQFLAFAQAFSSVSTDGGISIRSADNIAGVVSSYTSEQFKATIGTKLATAQAQASSASSSGSSSSTAPLSIYQVLSDSTLAAVVRGAYGLPDSAAALDPTEQIQLLTNAGFNVKDLNSPAAVSKLIDRFLGNAELQQSSSSASSDPLVGLFQSGNSDGTDPTPVDLSFLLPSNSTVDTNSVSGSILNLFA
jgi:hypothetical protein